MTKLEKASAYIDDDKIKEAEELYLEIFNDKYSFLIDKNEAALELGYIYSGEFDDVENNIIFKDLNKAKYYFRVAYIKGLYEAKLELALIYSLDKGVMTEEMEFALDTLLSSKYENSYKNECISLINNYIDRVWTESLNTNELIELFNKLSSYEAKSKNNDIIKVIHNYRKKISRLVAEKLLSEVSSVEECYKAKSILHDLNIDNVVGEAIGKLNEEIVRFEIVDFKDINNAEKIFHDIRRFDKKETSKLSTLFNDALNLKLAVSYVYGRNKASINYGKSIEYFSKITSNAVILKTQEKLEDIIKDLVTKGEFKYALLFVDLLSDDKEKEEIKNLINKKDEAIEFYKVLERANDGSLEDKLKLASFYKDGYCVEIDYQKSFDMYLDILFEYKSEEAFHELYWFFSWDFDDEYDVDFDLFDLFKFGKDANIEFTQEEKEEYDFFRQAFAKIDENKSSFIKMDDIDRTNLAKELKRRGITKLVHFTSEDNLSSILKMGGILSRKELEKYPSIKYSITDKNRFDEELNGISISITKPNEYMLNYKIKKGLIKNPYIIDIRPELLLDPDINFLFCESNAARRDKNKGSCFKDFKQMFQEDEPVRNSRGYITSAKRKYLYLDDNLPTDAQAEILVEGKIPMTYIIGAHKYKEGV